MAMEANFCREAVLHLVAGSLAKAGEVPVGSHKVGNLRVILETPELAVVTREEGTAGGGKDTDELKITQEALKLFIERSEIKGGARARKRWADCIRDAMKGMKGTLPPEAAKALQQVQDELPEPPTSKTSAKRSGAGEVKITIEELP